MQKKYFLRIKKEIAETKLLLNCIPTTIVVLFVISVIVMNILANKTIVNEKWIALDGGILISWLSFLSMDIITKHFGPKAATKMSLFATLINIFVCFIFYIVSIIPTKTDYSSFNIIIGGTWFILLSSTIAFLSSAVLNNFLNYSIGKMFHKNPNGRLAYMSRTYISTFVGQFFDNLIFACLTFMLFAPIFWQGFSWTFLQCLICSLTGAIVELMMEVLFSPFGYKICQKWKKEEVGKLYFALQNGRK